MTKKDALTIALSTLTADTYTNPSFDGKTTTRKEIPVEEVREVITNMIAQLSKPRKMSDEAKVKANEKRKQASQAKRKEYVAPIIPILYDGLVEPMTAKELYTKVKDNLPIDFTVGKVQAILLSDMADKVRKLTDGRNAMKYERI